MSILTSLILTLLLSVLPVSDVVESWLNRLTLIQGVITMIEPSRGSSSQKDDSNDDQQDQ